MDESPNLNFEEQYRIFNKENAWYKVFNVSVFN